MRSCALALFSVACVPTVSQTDGLQAALRVNGAQFFTGAEPVFDDGGPTVVSPQTTINTVELGQLNFVLSGELSPGSAAVAFQLQGDIGYWTTPALPNDDLSAPQNLSFSAQLSFNPDSPAPDGGLLVLEISAIDGEGNFGPPNTIDLTAISSFPTGATLVISLDWDTESDLDLHVIDPSGAEIWSDKQSLFVPPPYGSPPVTQTTLKSYGYLDFDSNCMCRIDGRREENVIWLGPTPDGGPYPPPGHYTVRIDTFSLCAEPDANWTIKTFLQGQIVAESQGQANAIDERPPHGAGAGLTVMEFDIDGDGGYAGL